MEALWATILFSGFALEVIIRPLYRMDIKKPPFGAAVFI
jgi:hypothetical protein